MTHPSAAAALQWDDPEQENGNTAKLALRNITPRDIEDVLFSNPTWIRNTKRDTPSWFMTGRDREGRTLRVLVLWADETDGLLRPIAAWPA